jgi:hypothetical protein
MERGEVIMPKTLSGAGGAEADKLLRVARYFRKPQRFIPIGDVRAEMRQTLEIASQGSVVITTHGEPQAAIVDFKTFEAVRGAIMHLLLAEMEASFNRTQKAIGRQSERVVQTSDAELEGLVAHAVYRARQERRKRASKRNRRE